MLEITPFRALRYSEDAGSLKELCCPPYDIISGAERQSFLDANPYNIIRLELPKAENSENSENQNDPYIIAGQFLRDWISKKILANDETTGIYIYEMEFYALGKTRKVKGFVSLVKLEEFSKGIVLPHEETLSKAKTDRFNLMSATKCNFSQIYSLYNDADGSVTEIINGESERIPDDEFKDGGGVIHRMWRAYDGDFHNNLCGKMADKKLYIADGHHRYETALNYRNYLREKGLPVGTSDYVPMFLVSMESPGLAVFPTHRVIRGLSDYSYENIIEKCRESFEITPYLNREKGEIGLEKAYAEDKKAFVLFTGDNNYTLLVYKKASVPESVMPSASEALRSLDVTVLHSLILERFFGIDKENMANQKNLSYTRSADEAISEVDGKRADCCFLLNPTRVSEIRDVAKAGEKMPQKSTYFYPKLTTGLVMNQIIK